MSSVLQTNQKEMIADVHFKSSSFSLASSERFNFERKTQRNLLKFGSMRRDRRSKNGMKRKIYRTAEMNGSFHGCWSIMEEGKLMLNN